MTPADDQTRVVSICDPGLTLNQINSSLEAQKDFVLIDNLDDPDNLIRDLHDIEADIAIIDHVLRGNSTWDLIDTLVSQFPNLLIIAILPNDDPINAQQAMLAGAQAFIIQPFTQANLLSTLRRMRDLQAKRKLAQPSVTVHDVSLPSQVNLLAVYSPRGGVGCSTLATNLAISLHEQTEARVLLMEGKLQFGHLDVMLNLRTHNSLVDLIPHASSMDETLVRDVVQEHVSGIYTLLAPVDFQTAQGVRPQDLFTVVTNLRRYFDFIIIDVGSHLGENAVTLLDSADKILLVSSPDIAALHDVSRFFRISQSLAYPHEKTLLVINRFDKPGGIKQNEFNQVLQTDVFAQIPDDSVEAERSINRGIPLVVNAPRSKASRSYKEFAKRIIELDQRQGAVVSRVKPSQ
jgi:pilus assembly protein CpaE